MPARASGPNDYRELLSEHTQMPAHVKEDNISIFFLISFPFISCPCGKGQHFVPETAGQRA